MMQSGKQKQKQQQQQQQQPQSQQQQQQQIPHHHHHHHHQVHHIEGNKSSSRTASATVNPPSTLTFKENFAEPRSSSVTSEENDADYPESRYECAICLHWLNEPVLTSCGHRFCKSCLSAWLRNNNHCCPLDNKKLSTEQDVFPDNYTRREIEQIKFKCPNSPLGCNVIDSPIEVDRHLPSCPYRHQKESTEEKCPFSTIKCEFIGRASTNALEEHLKDDMPHHMQLMLQAFQKTAISTWNAQKPLNGHNKSDEADEQLIRAMYQRIVVLEQNAREQEVKLENLTKQLNTVREQVDPRYSSGIIVWEIQNFQQLIEHLRANANNQVYSKEGYTSPYGYKFCARLNIQPKKSHLLSLHVHLMQSENDFHLDWPFMGRIKLSMVHPRESKLTQHDTIMTKPEILAFHQPRERISTRGFGFVEYASIADMIHKGFTENDRLCIKIQINIV